MSAHTSDWGKGKFEIQMEFFAIDLLDLIFFRPRSFNRALLSFHSFFRSENLSFHHKNVFSLFIFSLSSFWFTGEKKMFSISQFSDKNSRQLLSHVILHRARNFCFNLFLNNCTAAKIFFHFSLNFHYREFFFAPPSTVRCTQQVAFN